jgi:hypothetical protein
MTINRRPSSLDEYCSFLCEFFQKKSLHFQYKHCTRGNDAKMGHDGSPSVTFVTTRYCYYPIAMIPCSSEPAIMLSGTKATSTGDPYITCAHEFVDLTSIPNCQCCVWRLMPKSWGSHFFHPLSQMD